MSKYHDEAVSILQRNDRGDYTVPTSSGLYPAQWNWDSCLVALGWAQFNEERAWQEINSLFAAQWPDGMVPHIVFHGDDNTYFPNSHIWAAGPGKRTSGITQPPVAAIVVRYLYEKFPTSFSRAKTIEIIPKLIRWHEWFYYARDRQGTGLVAIIHPWETGMDNSPVWDEALGRVPEAASVAHLRRDIKFAATRERPTEADYNRYIHLLHAFRAHDYSPDKLFSITPFRILDVGFNSILARANRDLAFLRNEIANDSRAVEYPQSVEELWDESAGFYFSLDALDGKLIRKPGIGSFLPLFADSDIRARHPQIEIHLRRWLAKLEFGLCSFDPDRPEFEPQRYWRGPVWLIVNWMLIDGLRRNGCEELADRLLKDSLRLPETHGFFEYYDARSGKGLGGPDFSWTAAMYLFLKEPPKPARLQSLSLP
jgi:hypothetical protein